MSQGFSSSFIDFCCMEEAIDPRIVGAISILVALAEKKIINDRQCSDFTRSILVHHQITSEKVLDVLKNPKFLDYTNELLYAFKHEKEFK